MDKGSGIALKDAPLKDSGKRTSSWWEEVQTVPPVVHLAWEEKWPDMQLHADTQAVAHGLCGWPGPWQKHDWKTGDKEGWRVGMWIDLSSGQRWSSECAPNYDLSRGLK